MPALVGRREFLKVLAGSALVSQIPGVAFSTDYPYMCSAPGQKIVMNAIKQHGLLSQLVGLMKDTR